MRSTLALALAFAFLLGAGPAAAALPNTYQVTGPVLEVRDDMVVVQKGKEKWQIARTQDTKVTGELKVGAKVTIEYRMTATTVDVKSDPAAKDAKPATAGKKKEAAKEASTKESP